MHHGEVGLNPPQDKPLIDVEHLTRAFGTREQRVTVLDDVSFGVPRGSLFGIAGPSGSGKSTLLNLLTGLDRPTSGRVLFDGLELRARSENQLARWRGHQQRTLPDGDRRVGADPGQPGLDLADFAGVPGRGQVGQRGPPLAARR